MFYRYIDWSITVPLQIIAFSLILLAMLTVLADESSSGEDDGSDSRDSIGWLVIRPLLSSAVVLLCGALLFKVVDGRAAYFDGTVRRLPTRVVGLITSRTDELLLLLLICGGNLCVWLAEGFYSSALLGVFCLGTVFCTTPRAAHAFAAAGPLQAWLSRLFFGCTVGFVVPVGDLFESRAFGEGLVLTVAAILGKFLSGAWGESIAPPGEPVASRFYWGAFLRIGCAMIGRGELGFMLAVTSLEDRIISQRAYSATVWALMLATLLGPFAFRLSMKVSCGLRPQTKTAQDEGEAALGVDMKAATPVCESHI